MIEDKKIYRARWTGIAAISLFAVLFGFSLVYHLMRDGLCLAYLGCNSGFFGYDGLIHLVSGVGIAAWIIWIFRSRLAKTPNLLTVLAFAALACVTWEILEYGYDYVRTVILHIDLIHPLVMAQPSNADTMGDMMLSLFGSLVTALFIL